MMPPQAQEVRYRLQVVQDLARLVVLVVPRQSLVALVHLLEAACLWPVAQAVLAAAVLSLSALLTAVLQAAVVPYRCSQVCLRQVQAAP